MGKWTKQQHTAFRRTMLAKKRDAKEDAAVARINERLLAKAVAPASSQALPGGPQVDWGSHIRETKLDLIRKILEL